MRTKSMNLIVTQVYIQLTDEIFHVDFNLLSDDSFI